MIKMTRAEAQQRFGHIPDSTNFVVTNGIIVRLVRGFREANQLADELKRQYGLDMQQIKVQNISK